ncbi:cupin domain-containing protein [Halalkalibacter alkalisediminis]|uniref:Cupin domain-containing protein n=1 Tax=Halalkalibacter alkalisediminis TaxID=935616 RepID=A0ABV6NHZ1_9BACI|nr:cupin domain-containing protein [Halalkalibacter alkalisediminis]
MVTRNILNNQGSLMFVKVELKERFHGEIDQHVEEQISYIESGSVEFEVGGVKRLLKKGDIQYIPSNAEHRVRVIEECVILDVFTPLRKELAK